MLKQQRFVVRYLVRRNGQKRCDVLTRFHTPATFVMMMGVDVAAQGNQHLIYLNIFQLCELAKLKNYAQI